MDAINQAMITSSQNPLVKRVRKLHRPKERHRQGLFLLEGTHLLQTVQAENYPIETFCCTPEWQARYPKIWAWGEQQATEARLVSAEALKAMATTITPDGVIATASRKNARIASSDDFFHPLSLGVILDRVQDPGNLGTIIRTTAAAGGEGLALSSDSVDVDHPKVLRASAGQWFRLPMGVFDSLPTVLQSLTTQQIVATSPTADLTYWDLDFCQPTLLLMGNEGAGLSPDLMALATHQVKIPLAAGVESLNVAIATALLLYEAQRQRQRQ